MRGMNNYINNMGKKNLIGCEVGVAQGLHAVEIFNNLDIKKLYLVDPYMPYVDWDGYIKKRVIFDKSKAIINLSAYSDRYEFIYKSSKRACKLFEDGFFDFIYVDDNHSRKHVKQSGESWYPKVKDGGVFGGHDFNSQHASVIEAVLDFIDEYNLQLCGFDDEDWWVKKTKII